MAIFTVKSKEITDAEIQRIHGLQTPNVTVQIESVDFRHTDEVKPSEPKTVKPIDIPPAVPVFVGEQMPSLQERFRERFGGIRARIQSRRF